MLDRNVKQRHVGVSAYDSNDSQHSDNAANELMDLQEIPELTEKMQSASKVPLRINLNKSKFVDNFDGLVPLLSAAIKVERERESDEESNESEFGKNESMH
jgi:hypothetical protein